MSEKPDQPGAWNDPGWVWPVVQPPIYVMTAGSDAMSRAGSRVAKVAGKAWPVAAIVLGAVATAAAAWYVPRLLEGFGEPETVDLDVEE